MGTVRPTGVYMFKWLDKNGTAHGGDRPFKYSLPVGEIPGKWHTKKDPSSVRACEYGFHCIGYNHIEDYESYGPRLFLVEVAGAFHPNPGDGKVAVQSIRLIKELHPKIGYEEGDDGDFWMEGPFTDKIPKGYVKYVLSGGGKVGVDPIGVV